MAKKKGGRLAGFAFYFLAGENTLFRLRGALHGRAVHSVPIPVSFQLHHDWGRLPDACAARPVRNPVGAARCPGGLPDQLARTAAQTDSPARVTWRRTCVVSANCRHGCTAAGCKKDCTDWLPKAGERPNRGRQAFTAAAISTKYGEMAEDDFPDSQSQNGPVFRSEARDRH